MLPLRKPDAWEVATSDGTPQRTACKLHLDGEIHTPGTFTLGLRSRGTVDVRVAGGV